MDTDEQLQTYLAALSAFGERVHAVGEDRWQGSTPCADWSVADLVGHMVEEHRWAAPLLHGMDMDAAGKIVEGSRSLPVDGGVGANLAEEWDEAAAASADAFSEDGALEREVSLSSGQRPAQDYLREMTFDLVVHGWDLQTAIGFDGALPDALVSWAMPVAESFASSSDSAMFKASVSVPDDAPPVDRLVALTGRTPR